ISSTTMVVELIGGADGPALALARAALGRGLPLVIIHDTAESAEDYSELMLALAPRPCFALSLRGRGQSGQCQQACRPGQPQQNGRHFGHAKVQPFVAAKARSTGMPRSSIG
ncbi:MAG: hypothetical protein RQ806_09430, partial [Erythrobacter sp.]|nr:hypothetical protein [Erythrobacter sp.]